MINLIFNLISSTSDAVYIILVVFAYLISILVAITFHEVAHGYAAKFNGDLTAKVNGRLSFNPVVHFDPIGFAMLLFVGFGFAKPVPVNPYNFKHPKRGLISVSLAGVVMNFILAVLSMLLLVMIVFIAFNTEMIFSDFGYYSYVFLQSLFSFMIVINLSLMLFNLLPLGPLDGLKLLEALTRRGNRFVNFLREKGLYILFGLVLWGILCSRIEATAPIFKYFDILGVYLHYGVRAFAQITRLFELMFGLSPGQYTDVFFSWSY